MIYVERKTFSQQNSKKNTENAFGQVMCGKFVFELCLSALTVLKVYPQIRKSSRRAGGQSRRSKVDPPSAATARQKNESGKQHKQRDHLLALLVRFELSHAVATH